MTGKTTVIYRSRTAGDAEQARILEHYKPMIIARRERQLRRVEAFNRAIRSRATLPPSEIRA